MKRDRTGNGRIWELDFFRGIAIALMVYFHIIYDLAALYSYDISFTSGINYYIGKASAILFMFISGISSHFSSNNVKRGIRLLLVAAGLSIATHILNPALGVKFGILHFLGTSMILFPLFNRLKTGMLIFLAILFIIAGNIFNRINANVDYFFIFNIYSPNFSSSDYYPLLPWLGIPLLGVVFGRIFYNNKKSLFLFSLKDNIISWLGRKSIFIYLIHQPVILGILALIHRIK